jgi:TRAP transporter TAXI family solute receptor
MIRIGTAEPNSTFLTQGQALAKVLGQQGVTGPIEVLVSPAASIDNANRLDRGEIELGFMAANWIGRAKRGEKPFTHPIDLRLVAPMNLGPLFFITKADSGIATFDDLAGKRVSVGPAGSGMTQHAHTMLGALGHTIDWMKPAYLSFADGAKALAAGEIDAQLQCPIPNKVMTELDAAVPLRVVRYSAAQLETMLSKVSFYRRAIMRKGALKALGEDVPQPGVVNVLVCHARADKALLTTIAKAISDGARELGRHNALFEGLDDLIEPYRRGTAASKIGGVELHAGALAAYAASR